MKKYSRTKNTGLNLVTSFSQQIINTILRFAVRTVFISTLGSAYLGINGLFADILSMLSITELGFDTAINFKLYKPLAEGDTHTVRLYLKFYKMAYRVVAVVIVAFGLILIPFLPNLISDYDTLATLHINAVLIYLLYLVQSASTYLFFAYRTVIVKADQKMYLLNTASFVITILTSIAQIAVLKISEDFIIYTIVITVFGIISNLVQACIATKEYPEYFIKEKDNLQKSEIVSLFKDCGALLIFKIDSTVLKATDNLVISAFLGITIVGLYSNYQLFYTTCKTILSRLYVSVKDSMGNYFAQEDNEHKYALFESMNLLTVMLYGVAAVGIAVCANELIICWIGAEYVLAQPLPILVGVELLFSGVKLNLSQIRTISGIFRQMWYRPLIGIILNIVVSIALVLMWGVNGVVVGTIVSSIFANFALDPILIHKYTFEGTIPVSRYYKRNFQYFLLLVLVYVLDFLICNHLFVGFGWLSVIIHALICCCSVLAIFTVVYSRQQAFKILKDKALYFLKR